MNSKQLKSSELLLKKLLKKVKKVVDKEFASQYTKIVRYGRELKRTQQIENFIV